MLGGEKKTIGVNTRRGDTGFTFIEILEGPG